MGELLATWEGEPPIPVGDVTIKMDTCDGWIVFDDATGLEEGLLKTFAGWRADDLRASYRLEDGACNHLASVKRSPLAPAIAMVIIPMYRRVTRGKVTARIEDNQIRCFRCRTINGGRTEVTALDSGTRPVGQLVFRRILTARD